MQKYRRITHEDRCQIYVALKTRISKGELAHDLGFHSSTIYRELKRNREALGQYNPGYASKRARINFQKCRRQWLIGEDKEGILITLLMQGLSPEQIVGRLKLEKKKWPSTQSIYNYLRVRARHLLPYLRRFGRYGEGRFLQQKRRIWGRTYIDQRPKRASNRKRLGDWERDTFFSANREAFLVCVDRKSRLLKLARSSVLAIEVEKITTKLLENYKVHTLTNDNGSEFTQNKKINYPVYFCHPRKPQQRGTVENTIGLLREYIKRKSNTKGIKDEDIKYIENLMNNRPRKVLGFLTPNEVHFNKFVALAS